VGSSEFASCLVAFLSSSLCGPRIRLNDFMYWKSDHQHHRVSLQSSVTPYHAGDGLWLWTLPPDSVRNTYCHADGNPQLADPVYERHLLAVLSLSRLRHGWLFLRASERQESEAGQSIPVQSALGHQKKCRAELWRRLSRSLTVCSFAHALWESCFWSLVAPRHR